MHSEPAVLSLERRGALAVVTLDRPDATNILSLSLLQHLRTILANSAADDSIGAVLVRANGRVFSSGGDLYAILAHPPGAEFDRFRRRYFATEFALDRQIRQFPKPYIGIADGLTIGGGCGLALLGSHPVATERTLLSLPETGIGYFPDAGATWYLNRLPGEMGVYIGLRGQRLAASDAMALGLAAHYLRSEAVDAVIDRLAGQPRLSADVVSATLAGLAATPGPPAVAPRQAQVDALFAGDDVRAILARLEAAPEAWARAAAETLRYLCPTSLKVTLRALRAARGQPFDAAIRTEYRICVRMTGRPDFREGVRAMLIDKDKQPRWHQASLDAVSADDVESFFAPLEPDEPELDFR
jgi:enoyl-CoA hydratase